MPWTGRKAHDKLEALNYREASARSILFNSICTRFTSEYIQHPVTSIIIQNYQKKRPNRRSQEKEQPTTGGKRSLRASSSITRTLVKYPDTICSKLPSAVSGLSHTRFVQKRRHPRYMSPYHYGDTRHGLLFCLSPAVQVDCSIARAPPPLTIHG